MSDAFVTDNTTQNFDRKTWLGLTHIRSFTQKSTFFTTKGSQMVDKILQLIHHVRINVMKSD